jgi:DNA polymerase III delta prime subunit
VEQTALDAILSLSAGDMRRALNILQVQSLFVLALYSHCACLFVFVPGYMFMQMTSMANTHKTDFGERAPDVVTAAAVYASTGQPTPEDIRGLASRLLNEPFAAGAQGSMGFLLSLLLMLESSWSFVWVWVCM